MGQIVGAAITPHHPAIVRSEADRLRLGDGHDTDLVPGFARIRKKIDALDADTFVLFDTHWISTSMNLVAGQEHYKGVYTSDELPHVLSSVPYDYPGAPELAARVQDIAKQREFPAFNATDPHMANHYGTLNILSHLRHEEKVMSVSACQNGSLSNYLEMGAIIGQAIADIDCRVVMLASGALSHAFTRIDETPRNPNFFSSENIFSDQNMKLDHEVIGLFGAGRHDQVLDRYCEIQAAKYEGWGSHYFQMVGALGGGNCRLLGVPMSEYENARGTGNILIWFDVPSAEQQAA
ncbi:MAG: extradiol ring-cleavage dioxygenase [Proteobacteria bacterium]|nr:extradiol ring-cleavage dioxygenase [Pseudomonadota bacterium]